MADEVDRAQDLAEPLLEADVNVIRQRVANMPAGSPGECDLCGEFSQRLVKSVCAPCRDRHKLP